MFHLTVFKIYENVQYLLIGYWNRVRQAITEQDKVVNIEYKIW